MRLTKDIQKYICFSEHSLLEVLKKISDNKSRIIFIVSEHGKLLGSLSDGDIRRWLINSEKIDTDIIALNLMNSRVKRVMVGTDKNEIESLFSDGIDCIPLTDSSGHLVQLAFKSNEGFVVEGREVSDNSPCFIIAEIGNNHQGSIELAKELVDHAIDAGVDCVKFQMRDMSSLYRNSGDANDASVDLGAQYTLDLLAKFQLTNDNLMEVFDYAKSKGIIPLCTPWDIESLRVLENYGMPAYKIASADFTNHQLLEAIAKTGKPIFCSTGMSSEDEIKDTVSFLDKNGANYVLLHCNSTYPTPYKDVNLKYLCRLKKITGKLVGYSGHERGVCVPIAAIALGACVIEKHLTVNKSYEGTDHKVSLLPHEFSEMVYQIRDVEVSLGSEKLPREITQGELLNRENLAKSLITNIDIKIGSKITREMIDIRSPGQGLQPNRLSDLVGKIANRDISRGDFFYLTDIIGQVIKRDYFFNRPFGVPVRYHDYRQITKGTNLDFVEFHLSYKDMDINLNDYFSQKESIGFAIHCPELFEQDHILDLSSQDNEYRELSISLLQRVINITRDLKHFFPKTINPVIVVNAGGWDSNGFISQNEKIIKYNRISESLATLDTDGVTIAIQTMPPYPWHFGGQSFHNLFVCADEIVDFCTDNPTVKICLDVSHSMMSCNYYGWDLIEFVKKISPYNVHMHIVDAKGVDGEGVKIGDGDVDFLALMQLLDLINPGTPFIPEVWQGHKNGGEGFWAAFEYLGTIDL